MSRYMHMNNRLKHLVFWNGGSTFFSFYLRGYVGMRCMDHMNICSRLRSIDRRSILFLFLSYSLIVIRQLYIADKLFSTYIFF
jgi:hypothetical protein